MDDDGRDSQAEAWHQELQNEKLREELDCLVVVHKHGLEGTAKKLAVHLGLTKQFQQEIDARARSANVG
jgi:hypothetical protein